MARAGGYTGRPSDGFVAAQGWSGTRLPNRWHLAMVGRRLGRWVRSLPDVAQARLSVEGWVRAAVWCALGALALRPLTTSSTRFVVAGALVVLGVATVWGTAHFFGIGCAGAAGGAVLAAFNWCSVAPLGAGLPSLGSTAGLGASLVSGSLLGRRVACRRPPADTSAVGAVDAAAGLAAEHDALLRLATVGAAEPSPSRVFGSITHEVGNVLGFDLTALMRYECDASATVLGAWSRDRRPPPVGSRWRRGDDPAAVVTPSSELGEWSSVDVPLLVEGRVWGVIVGASCSQPALGEDGRRRLERFMGLAASVVAGAAAREELAATRARIVASADTARRQIERDLHDGLQQRLVSLALDVRRAEALLDPGQQPLLLSELRAVRDGLDGALDELRDVCHGIHPAILAEVGLRPALAQLGRRSPLPVTLDVKAAGRLPEPVEVCLYYVASEALANAIKHARATHVVLDLETSGSEVRLHVSDDGVGGADVRLGSGLTGLADRLHAVGGALEVQSASGQGTRLSAHVPLPIAC